MHGFAAGAGQGIGRAFAHALGEAGAAVAVADINGDAAECVAAELAAKGVRATAITADVTQAKECQRCASGTLFAGAMMQPGVLWELKECPVAAAPWHGIQMACKTLLCNRNTGLNTHLCVPGGWVKACAIRFCGVWMWHRR